MDISVVIPNYNGRKLLEKNLPNILKILEEYKGGKKELVITDDASRDESLIFLDAFFQKYHGKVAWKVLKSTASKNQGFASNVNKGVRGASGEIVILLNSDVIPHKDFLPPLLSHFSDEKVFAVGCLDESIEDGKTVLRGRGEGAWKKGFLVHRAGPLDRPDTLWVSCGSGAFRKTIWNTLGGLEELYNPFYWEDIDLSYRAQKSGFKVIFEKRSIVVHAHEEGSIKKNYSSFSVKKTAYRNQIFFTWLNATDKMLLVSHILFIPYFLLTALRNKDRAFLLGFFQALLSFRSALSERKKIQSMVTLSDRDVVGPYSA